MLTFGEPWRRVFEEAEVVGALLVGWRGSFSRLSCSSPEPGDCGAERKGCSDSQRPAHLLRHQFAQQQLMQLQMRTKAPPSRRDSKLMIQKREELAMAL